MAMKYLLVVFFLVSCAVQKPAHTPRSEEDFVYVYHGRYWMQKEFVDSFGKKPPDSLLLKYHQNFTLWGSK
jgi:hypothetical protein